MKAKLRKGSLLIITLFALLVSSPARAMRRRNALLVLTILGGFLFVGVLSIVQPRRINAAPAPFTVLIPRPIPPPGEPGMADQPPQAPPPPSREASVSADSTGMDFQGFGLISPDEGWLLINQHLYWTKTGGQNWRDITPPNLGESIIRAVFFLDTQHGWLILTDYDESGFYSYAVARTLDSGSTWQSTPLSLFELGDVDAFPGAVYLRFINSQTGWLVIKRATSSNFSLGTLFKTTDGGITWTRLTIPIGEPVYFVTSEIGWTAGGAAGNELYRTQDGGLTWYPQMIESASAQSNRTLLYHLPTFVNAQEGVLPVVVTGHGEAHIQFYVTHNGGETWSLATSIPVEQDLGTLVPLAVLDIEHWAVVVPPSGQLWRVSDRGETTTIQGQGNLYAGISELDMVTPSAGWAKHISGGCARGSQEDVDPQSSFGIVIQCSLEIKLLRTDDGGGTWTALSLPQVESLQSTGGNAQTLAGETISGQTFAGPTLSFVGQGFDSCRPPSLDLMQNWIVNSPYQVWNLYIGGSSRGCDSENQAAITTSFVSSLSRQGWKFIPTWVGPQAPCTGYSSRMSYNPSTAYSEGASEADKAIDVAANLGLTLADKSGTIIYYDLEKYNTGDTACRNAVNSFLSGWSSRLRARGNLAGVYGNGPSLNRFATDRGSNNLDAIWPAHWIYNYYNGSATVWNVYELSNDLWKNHQRIRQYAGGHTERWPPAGGVSWNIDNDVIDGIVANIACPQSGGVILYRGANFDCGGRGEGSGYVFQNAAGGQNIPSAFNDQASSLRIPSGWSVRLFEHFQYTGGSVCRNGNDGNFAGDYFSNGVLLDNRVSSFWVFDSPNCATFTDVPMSHRYYEEIEALFRSGFIAGCSESPRMYCPDRGLNRAEAAVFVVRGVHGGGYIPDRPTEQIFDDVPLESWAAKWATALREDGYTAGCGTDPLIYCPWETHTRAEASVFFLRMLHGTGYVPPAPSGIFSDVPTSAWYAKWVEAAYQAGLIPDCDGQPEPIRFCPDDPILRDLAAYVMVQSKGLPLPDVGGSNINTLADNGLSFALSDATVQSMLAIPVLKYGTYFGGTGTDVGNGVAVDNAGNIYVAGYTDSPDFPGTGSLYGGRDAFVAKLRPDGNDPLYITYLGGSDLDEGYSIAVDDAGNAYALGYTDSSDFTIKNPLQPAHGGERDVFVAKLEANGGLVYSTYLGGSDTDEGFGLVVDSAGNAYVTGRTYSTDFPIGANPLQGNNAGGYDAFVAKLNANGGLVYSTYLGGDDADAANGLAVDAAGNVYLTGDTGSTNFPLQSPLQGSKNGGQDAFVAKLNANGSQLIYSTYLGGSGGDFGGGITVDGAGNAYLTGHTVSTNFPLANPLQNAHGGGSYDAFVAKLSVSGSVLVYSTYLGGSGGDEGYGIVADNTGLTIITGRTGSGDFPTVGLATTANGVQDLFVVSLSADGGQLLFSRYLGGSAGDQGEGIALDSEGNVFLTGYTLSPNFPVVNSLQATMGGDRDAFVAKIGEGYTLYLPLILK